MSKRHASIEESLSDHARIFRAVTVLMDGRSSTARLYRETADLLDLAVMRIEGLKLAAGAKRGRRG